MKVCTNYPNPCFIGFHRLEKIANQFIELVDPLLKLCARPWQDIFRKFLPKRIDALAADLAGHLDEFQQDVAKRPAITQSLSYGFVSQQTKGFVEVIKDTAALKTELRREQKDANRLFLPAIAGAMSTVYLTCGQETGMNIISIEDVLVLTHD